MKLVSDQMNQRLTVPLFPQRIVSLVPSQTELLHYWGLGDRVVGITKFCVHPQDWHKNKTRIGGTKTINFEKIKELKPDLIIGNKEENTESEIKLLQKNYPVWMSDMQNLNDAFEMMHLLGIALNVEAKAADLIRELKQKFDNLSQQLLTQKRQKVAYFIWKNPYMVAAADTFIDDLLNKIGFENTFKDLKRYPVLTKEDLMAAKPAIIFLSSEPYPFKEADRQHFQEICPQAKILVVDGELFSWYGSRLLHSTDYFLNLSELCSK